MTRAKSHRRRRIARDREAVRTWRPCEVPHPVDPAAEEAERWRPIPTTLNPTTPKDNTP